NHGSGSWVAAVQPPGGALTDQGMTKAIESRGCLGGGHRNGRAAARVVRRSVDAPTGLDRGWSQESLEDDTVALGPLLQLVEPLAGHVAREPEPDADRLEAHRYIGRAQRPAQVQVPFDRDRDGYAVEAHVRGDHLAGELSAGRERGKSGERRVGEEGRSRGAPYH